MGNKTVYVTRDTFHVGTEVAAMTNPAWRLLKGATPSASERHEAREGGED